jgi:polyhydroxyalkanoate synthesis regulator phasin
MNLPLVVASIIARIKARNGIEIDEAHLADAIRDGLQKLQTENETAYLRMISELTEQVEILSKHVGQLRNASQFNNAQHGND